MITFLAVLCGAGLGAGTWVVLVCLLPPRPSLARALAAAHHAPHRAPPDPSPQPGGGLARVGAPAARLLVRLGLPGPERRRDLQVLGQAPETFLAQKAVLALTGLLAPTLAQAVLMAGGLAPGWQFPVLVGLGGAVGGFRLPDLRVRARAARTRTTFRHALSAYLNLTRITLAGGAGVEGALWDAAHVGDGPAFGHLCRALRAARLTRTTPWAGLWQLGEELDIPELAELASSVALAGTEGAKVRASLAAKAAALRTRELTDSEGDAHAATERMSLPVALLFAGFLVFLGYPALATVLAGL